MAEQTKVSLWSQSYLQKTCSQPLLTRCNWASITRSESISPNNLFPAADSFRAVWTASGQSVAFSLPDSIGFCQSWLLLKQSQAWEQSGMLDILPGCSEQHKTPKASNITNIFVLLMLFKLLWKCSHQNGHQNWSCFTDGCGPAVKSFSKTLCNACGIIRVYLWPHLQWGPKALISSPRPPRWNLEYLGSVLEPWQCGGTPTSFLWLAQGTAVQCMSAGMCFTYWAFTQDFARACLTLEVQVVGFRPVLTLIWVILYPASTHLCILQQTW